MSLTATQQHFTKFYLAAFLRAPDLGGLNYWANEVQSGKSLQHVGGIIFSLPIVTNVYPASLSDLDFVEAIYHNVFGRTSDAEGLNYWSNEIATLRNGFIAQGHDPAFAAFEARGQLTINMINAGLGTPDGTDGKAYIVNRLTVAEYAAEQQLVQGEEIAVAFLLEMFGQVDVDPHSVPRGNSEVNSYLSSAIALSDIANGAGGFVINGQTGGDESGVSVSSAGDVNGDGLDDLIIGAKFADPSMLTDAGKSYVVFGKTNTQAINLLDIANGSGGFVINGQTSLDFSGDSVSAAGDINGDGLADIIVGARFADPLTGEGAGKSYVVFGKPDGTAVELSNVSNGAGGFVINGEAAFDNSGISVSAAGDINGDGRADLIVGALFAGNQFGKAYVVFGKSDGTAIELGSIATGSGGFSIEAENIYHYAGTSVSAAGDVNGDGLADVIVSAPQAGSPGRDYAGAVYVVFGKTTTAPVRLSDIAGGAGGFVINGQTAYDSLGNTTQSVSAAGDVNGDGLADLIVGSNLSAPTSGANAGKTYVVYGKATGGSIDLVDVALGTGGFVINGESAGDESGYSVSAAGDINGDGIADLILGAPEAVSGSTTEVGKSYVIYGATALSEVNLSDIANGLGGFVVHGEGRFDASGTSVSAAGDINGDGLADLVVGANGLTEATGVYNAGRTYVIFGSTTGAFSQTAVDQFGASGNDDTLNDNGTAQTLVGNSGNDTLIASAASVLYAGLGDDSFVIASAMIDALSNPLGAGGNLGQLARIDGGAGIDTIMLSDDGLNLDLTQIANIGFDAIGFSRIESVEKIDLTGTGNNTLTLAMRDVMDMAGFNVFEATGRHQVMVTGNAGDVLNIVDGSDWTQGASVTLVGVNYAVWNANHGLATLYVDTALSLI